MDNKESWEYEEPCNMCEEDVHYPDVDCKKTCHLYLNFLERWKKHEWELKAHNLAGKITQFFCDHGFKCGNEEFGGIVNTVAFMIRENTKEDK